MDQPSTMDRSQIIVNNRPLSASDGQSNIGLSKHRRLVFSNSQSSFIETQETVKILTGQIPTGRERDCPNGRWKILVAALLTCDDIWNARSFEFCHRRCTCMSRIHIGIFHLDCCDACENLMRTLHNIHVYSSKTAFFIIETSSNPRGGKGLMG